MINGIFLDANSVVNGLTTAKTNALQTIKPTVNQVVVPLLCAAATAFILFFIFKCLKMHRAGEDYHNNLIGVIVCAVILAVISTFPAWGWSMAGV